MTQNTILEELHAARSQILADYNGGVFGTMDNLSGPYGGVVGLVVGAIVIAIPIMDKP